MTNCILFDFSLFINHVNVALKVQSLAWDISLAFLQSLGYYPGDNTPTPQVLEHP